MDARVLLIFIVLGTSWCCNARVVTTSLSPIFQDVIASELQINEQQRVIKDTPECTFCIVVLAPTVDYLSNTTNQTEILALLHLLCSLTFIVKDQCNAIVDYYVPQIFNETSTLTPKDMCTNIGLCKSTNMSRHLSENSCESCHHAVTDASLKLNHPDSQLHIVELVLKACDAMEDSVNNYCKRLVLASAQLVPIYAKQMFDGHALCNLLYDCNSSANIVEKSSNSGTYLHSAF